MAAKLHETIVAPVISEKGTLVNETGNQVLFRVRASATKEEIRKAVETFFGVRVKKVRTLRLLGKTRRVGRHMGTRPSWKKAYVTLAEGDNIDFFENV